MSPESNTPPASDPPANAGRSTENDPPPPAPGPEKAPAQAATASPAARDKVRYQRFRLGFFSQLAGDFQAFSTRRRLWLGPDHMLLVETAYFNERYRRFFYRDIEAFILRRTVQSTVLSLVLGALCALWLILVFVGWGTWFQYFSVVMLSIFGGLFLFNLVAGPTCQCCIRTGVQTESLPFNRLRYALQAIERLRPLIESAQADLPKPAQVLAAPEIRTRVYRALQALPARPAAAAPAAAPAAALTAAPESPPVAETAPPKPEVAVKKARLIMPAALSAGLLLTGIVWLGDTLAPTPELAIAAGVCGIVTVIPGLFCLMPATRRDLPRSAAITLNSAAIWSVFHAGALYLLWISAQFTEAQKHAGRQKTWTELDQLKAFGHVMGGVGMSAERLLHLELVTTVAGILCLAAAAACVVAIRRVRSLAAAAPAPGPPPLPPSAFAPPPGATAETAQPEPPAPE